MKLISRQGLGLNAPTTKASNGIPIEPNIGSSE
jgi:hypothetical protein